VSGADHRGGVVLMTYGSPRSLERADIATYLTRVRGGRAPGDDLVDEFTRRYRRIGGSPLVRITASQARALEQLLGWPVEIGMRFSDPSIASALGRLTDRGAQRIAAIVLSPQYSPLLMSAYDAAVEDALQLLADRAPVATVAHAWHLQPDLIAALASRIEDALRRLPSKDRGSAPVLLTAHSLPRRVAEREPEYIAQLMETADAVAGAAGLVRSRWRFCWQSAGHEPGEWMKPDFADLMPELADAGHTAVVVAPVQFVADHLETLYDIDVGAREQAQRVGLAFERIRALNDDPGFIAALARVASETVAAGPEVAGIANSELAAQFQ
jgi:ferrochelatase